jgi:SAM-dependent methyltransferase
MPEQPVYGLARQGWRTRVAERFARRARRQRRDLFRRLVAPRPAERILDVGSGETGLAGLEPSLDVTGTDRVDRPEYPGPFVRADGRRLPFGDGEFDVAYSNSVIEHVVEPSDRRALAEELRRVGGRYFVQTPNRWFPVEQHLLTPIVHWLPRSWQRAVVPRFTVWSAFTPATPDRRRFYLEHYLSDVRLLAEGELRRLFPGARIIRERFCGWTKSLIAVSGGIV